MTLDVTLTIYHNHATTQGAERKLIVRHVNPIVDTIVF
jgi:hypothetical protein